MDECIRDRAVDLICHQWEIKVQLNDPALTMVERTDLWQQLTHNIFQLAYLIDTWQNPLIGFTFKGETFTTFSDVVKHPQYELLDTENVVKHLFALNETTSRLLIDVEEVKKKWNDFLKLGLAFFYSRISC